MLQYMYLYYLQLYYCTSTSPRAAAFSLLHSLHTCLANAKFATEKKETEKAQCQVGKLALPTDKYAQGAGDGRGGEYPLEGRKYWRRLVRDRADSLGRKGASKRPAFFPPSPRQDGRGEKVMGFLEVNRTEIYGIMISSVVSYSLTDNGPKCN